MPTTMFSDPRRQFPPPSRHDRSVIDLAFFRSRSCATIGWAIGVAAFDITRTASDALSIRALRLLIGKPVLRVLIQKMS
jgi:hypothetical protein